MDLEAAEVLNALCAELTAQGTSSRELDRARVRSGERSCGHTDPGARARQRLSRSGLHPEEYRANLRQGSNWRANNFDASIPGAGDQN